MAYTGNDFTPVSAQFCPVCRVTGYCKVFHFVRLIKFNYESGIRFDCSAYICPLIRNMDYMKARGKEILLIVGMLAVLLFACSNGDGDLDHKWQLRQYRYADGSVKRQDSIFYNFQKGSFSAICLLKNGSYQTFFGNYSLKGDKISIILLPESVDEENYALYMGWENGERTFTVEELTGSSLCLEHAGIRYVFRKY